jgi:hypothetical protein
MPAGNWGGGLAWRLDTARQRAERK